MQCFRVSVIHRTLVDLTKAFDTVWKEGLLLKLLNNKVEGKLYNWIHDFLQYRTARVKLDGQIVSHFSRVFLRAESSSQPFSTYS